MLMVTVGQHSEPITAATNNDEREADEQCGRALEDRLIRTARNKKPAYLNDLRLIVARQAVESDVRPLRSEPRHQRGRHDDEREADEQRGRALEDRRAGRVVSTLLARVV